MKILHITASYKPAYVYGGPVMSVAKLCEELGVSVIGEQKAKVSNQTPVSGNRLTGVDTAVSGDQYSVIGNQKPLSSQQTADRGLSAIDVTVYTTLANGKEELPYKNGEVKNVDGVEVHYFKRITNDHSHLSPTLLWYLLKTVKKFDVVHIHAWWNLVTMPACLIAIIRGVKVVLTPRGTLSNYSFEVNNSKLKGYFHQYIGKPLLERTYFHCTSRKEVSDTNVLLNPKAIYNLPNFVVLPWEEGGYQDGSSKYQDSKLELQGDVLRLIFLSRIEKKKGLEMLFDVLATLTFDFELSIVGNGEVEYIESLKLKVKSLKLEQHVKWLGAVYGDDKFALMAAHDYLILPSFDENFANVVIESVFVGTPVLITKNVGLSDYVIDKNLGLVCDRHAESLKLMLFDALRLKTDNYFNAEILRKTVREDFAEEVLREKYLKMYEGVVGCRF